MAGPQARRALKAPVSATVRLAMDTPPAPSGRWNSPQAAAVTVLCCLIWWIRTGRHRDGRRRLRQQSVSCRNPGPRQDGQHTHPQERSSLEKELPGRSCLQRHPPRHQTLRAGQLEALVRLSCPTSDRSEDALLQSFGDRIASRDPDGRTADVHIRVALMNRFNALGNAEVESFT
jgi:hypothetical protein